MVGMDSEHFRIVNESLNGERVVDEQTFASLGALGERLEQLKALGEGFSDVAFSSAVSELIRQQSTIVV